MYVTLSVKELAIGLVLLSVVALIIYICMFFKNLIVTLKKTNNILDSVDGMAKVAEKRTKSVDNLIDNVAESISDEAADDGILKQISNIAAAVNNILKIVGKKPTKEDKKS